MSNLISQRLSNRKLLVDVLAVMFGISAWIGVNGIYVQLPLLVESAPEGWQLAANMVILIQIANLGPIFYTLYRKFSSYFRDDYIIYGLLAVAVLAMYLMAFTYKIKSVIFGSEHSTAFLSLMFINAVVGCTSSVLFLPYMRNYREIYLVSYLVGEGLSGFIPAIVALIQGVGGNPECISNSTKSSTSSLESTLKPRFSLEAFFVFLGTLLLLSFISFIGLNKCKVALGERVKLPECAETLTTDTNAPPSYKIDAGWNMSKQMYLYLLAIIAVICFLGHSALPAIQPFVCLPYGNVVYHLTLTLAAMANPLAMCLSYVRKIPKSVNLFTVLTGFILILSCFIIYLAAKSPTPPLQHSWIGEFIVVITWILINSLIGFVKIGVTTIFRADPGKGLYYTGIATQVGSLFGAITTYILVQHIQVFKQYNPCS